MMMLLRRLLTLWKIPGRMFPALRRPSWEPPTSTAVFRALLPPIRLPGATTLWRCRRRNWRSTLPRRLQRAAPSRAQPQAGLPTVGDRPPVRLRNRRNRWPVRTLPVCRRPLRLWLNCLRHGGAIPTRLSGGLRKTTRPCLVRRWTDVRLESTVEELTFMLGGHELYVGCREVGTLGSGHGRLVGADYFSVTQIPRSIELF